MPELTEQSTPTPSPAFLAAPPPHDLPGKGREENAESEPGDPREVEEELAPPAAIPPLIDPKLWESFPVYRETFLVYVTDPKRNADLRGYGELLHELVLEFAEYWPDQPEGWIRSNLRAAVADLRHLEGFLASLGEFPPENERFEAHLCRMAGRLAAEVAAVAGQIERELGSWRGEAS
ncbi:MAG TPA: hypothetical protein VF173_08740 [Thermoanaerobaculia bacterium]|nr:hypothetical protein [Thermoanaerobaculia bacterium]